MDNVIKELQNSLLKKFKKCLLDQEMMELYDHNVKFKAYVDRCAKADKRSLEDVLSLALVREAGKYYSEVEVAEARQIPAVNSTYAPMGECV